MEIHPSPPIASSSKHSHHHHHSKRRRSAASEDRIGGGSGRKEDGGGEGRKRARPPPPPPFPHAQRIRLNDISRDTQASEDHYVSGRVVDVRQWTEERRVSVLFIEDDSTPQPLKIFLRGSWVEKAPKADGSRPPFAILLRGLNWESAAGIGGTRNYAAVYQEGAVFQLRAERFDGFAAAKQITIKEEEASLEALDTVKDHSHSSQPDPPSNRDVSSVVPPPPAPTSRQPPSVNPSDPLPTILPSEPTPSSASPPLLLPHPINQAKRPRSPSSNQPGPSSKRVAFAPSDPPIDEDTLLEVHEPSVTHPSVVDQAPTSSLTLPPPNSLQPTETSPSTIVSHPRPPHISSDHPSAPPTPYPSPDCPMRSIITDHVLRFQPALDPDGHLLRRIVDALINLPQTDWSRLLLSDEVSSGRVKEIKAQILREEEKEEVERTQREDAAKVVKQDVGTSGETGKGVRANSGTARAAKEVEKSAVVAKEVVVQPRVEHRSSKPSPHPHHPPPNPPSPPSETASSSANLVVPSAATIASTSKLVVQPHPDDAPGPSRRRPLQQPETVARNQRYEEEEEEEEEDNISLHEGFQTTNPKYRYFSVADVKKQSLNRPTACVGVVTKILGPTKSSKDYYMILTLQDSTGVIDFKIFEGSRSNLPPVKLNDILLVRETPVKKFRETFELVGGSRDMHAWAFFDSELKTVVVQPNRLQETRDLVDIKKLDPSIKIYGRKLSRWLQSLEESMILQLKGRPTLRIEEIANERQFFDCVCQVVRYHPPDVVVTDFTSNPLLEDAPPCYEAEPTRPFGQFAFKISLWNDLASDDISSLRPGRFVKLHNIKPRPRMDHWEGSIFNSSGGRIERLKHGDLRLLELVRRRDKHVKRGLELLELEQAARPNPEPAAAAPPAPPRPLVQPEPLTIVVVPPLNGDPMEVDEPSQQVWPLEESREAGPSQTHLLDASMEEEEELVLPSVKGKERERAESQVGLFSGRARLELESSERMVSRPEENLSPTQAIFYEKQHPNGTSLLEILSMDRAKFRTRARIVDFAPRALEDVVIASCERCDIDLPSSDKRCRNCNDITGDFTAWHYRLVFTLSDGTASIKAAVFDEEDMLTLFPGLPPASEFANSPTNPMEYLETQLRKLVGPSLMKEDSSTRRPGPLLDLSLRKFRVRGVPGVGKEGWAWSYRVFQSVIR